MHFVFRIGPISVPDGESNAYFVHPGKDDAIAFFADNDHAAFEQIVRKYEAAELACEPDLAAAAAEFHLGVSEITPERAHVIGLTAFDLANPGHLKGIQRAGIIFQFGVSCSRFWRASPWRYASTHQPLEVVLRGAVDTVLEGLVMGGDVEYGLCLYPDRGSVDRINELAHAGRVEEAARLNSLIVTLKDRPAFATDALRRAYGLPRLPVPIKMVDGAGVPLADLDVLTLAAALTAVSHLTDEILTATGRVKVSDLEVEAIVRAAVAAQ
jgi:hypothetical protein